MRSDFNIEEVLVSFSTFCAEWLGAISNELEQYALGLLFD
jgi:hypothetical protein